MSSKKITEPRPLPLKEYLERNRSRFMQNRLAFALEVSPEFLSDVINGIKKIPADANWVGKVAEFYGINHDRARELLGFEEGCSDGKDAR